MLRTFRCFDRGEGDPDQGAFMVKAKDPKGPWTEPVLVKPGKGIIDTCPFWDEDGKVYMVHAYAGSRAASGIASSRLSPKSAFLLFMLRFDSLSV